MSRFLKIGADGAQFDSDATNHVAVIDTTTNLMWSADDASPDNLNFGACADACKALSLASFTDWRMPTVEELFALADRSKFKPCIDTDAFPTAKADWYWSSTVDAASPSDYAWVVNFSYGGSFRDFQGGQARARAVRSVVVPASGQ